MSMASNGQITAHLAQPVQPGVSCRTACLGPQACGPGTSSHSTWGGQAATQRPQPVQRSGEITGRALGGVAMRPA
jgi:hypothetical protein